MSSCTCNKEIYSIQETRRSIAIQNIQHKKLRCTKAHRLNLYRFRSTVRNKRYSVPEWDIFRMICLYFLYIYYGETHRWNVVNDRWVTGGNCHVLNKLDMECISFANKGWDLFTTCDDNCVFCDRALYLRRYHARLSHRFGHFGHPWSW